MSKVKVKVKAKGKPAKVAPAPPRKGVPKLSGPEFEEARQRLVRWWECVRAAAALETMIRYAIEDHAIDPCDGNNALENVTAVRDDLLSGVPV